MWLRRYEPLLSRRRPCASAPRAELVQARKPGHEELGFWRKYLFSQDHKVIGIQYTITSLLFLFFGFSLVGERPFFFFKKEAKLGISYAGKELPLRYDELLHDLCCEPGGYNPSSAPAIVSFHARREATWYYVEAGLFEP